METKLEANTYETLDQFVHDARLIFNNCRRYNDAGSNCTFAELRKAFQICSLVRR